MTTQKNGVTQAASTATTHNAYCPVAWVTASICYYFAVLTVMVHNFIFMSKSLLLCRFSVINFTDLSDATLTF
jgi:hypothetical protein